MLRDFLSALAICALAMGVAMGVAAGAALAGEPVAVTVYKSPSCGCCVGWIDHLEEHGFSVTAHDLPDVTPVKRREGVPPQLASCHTALVGGYVVEGHVPAGDITRLLDEQPPVLGLAVPRMPVGSPGMEGPNPVPYDVLAFDGRSVAIFSSHQP